MGDPGNPAERLKFGRNVLWLPSLHSHSSSPRGPIDLDSWSCQLNALSSDTTPGHREPCAETNTRVGMKFAAPNIIDVSTIVALSYVFLRQVHTKLLVLSFLIFKKSHFRPSLWPFENGFTKRKKS